MCKEIKVRKLPKGFKVRMDYLQWGIDFNKAVRDEIWGKHRELIAEDVSDYNDYGEYTILEAKLKMLTVIKDYLKKEGLDFDEFNGLAPTRVNAYRAYEFTTVWVWSEIVLFTKNSEMPLESWYKKYGPCLASVMRKYPKITGFLISCSDLHLPGNKFLDVSKMEDADFDNDHTDEVLADDKAEEFKDWILKWCDEATEKDKMRVRNWFQTKKSHKQIFAEINKVVGNYQKFNSRLALFVERLFNQDGLDYFFEKTGFDSKEDMFLAYFDKLTDFDDETKRSFIKKYLLG
jgi:hypothetical protein